MPRARRGVGSVTQRKDGLWRARIELGYENGKRRSRDVYGATLAEARDKAVALRAKIANGESTRASRETVADLLAKYMAHREARDAANTHANKEIVQRLHIVPYIGTLKFATLKPTDVEDLYAQLRKKGALDRTVLSVHQLLHAAYEYALQYELPGVLRNPVARVERPIYESAEIEPYSADEARRFIDAMLGDPLDALYLVAIFSGMREGELLALQLRDLDLANGALHVRRSVQSSRTKSKSKLKRTKNESSRRAIPLHPIVVDALHAHRKRVIAAGIETTYVFPAADGGQRDRWSLLRRDFHPLLERANLRRIRFHDLRHSFASLLLALGTHPKVVQELGGWSDIRTLMKTYSHVIPSLGREAVEALVLELFRPTAASIGEEA